MSSEQREKIVTELSTKLLQIRRYARLSLREISEGHSITPQSLSYYELGSRFPTIAAMKVYTKIPNVSFEELMEIRIRTIKELDIRLGEDLQTDLKNELEIIKHYEKKQGV